MKKIRAIMNSPSSFFYMTASFFLFILILNQFHILEWIYSFLLVLKPLWVGCVIAFFLQPLIATKKKNALLHIILVYLIFLFSFLILFMIIFFLILENFDLIAASINDMYPVLVAYMERYQIFNYIDTNQIQGFLMDGYELLVPFIHNFISFLTTFTLSIMISFFISLESDIIANEFRKYVKDYEKYFDMYAIFSNILRQYIHSTLLDMIYVIVTTTAILYFFHTPYAPLLAILLAFLNLFPYVGAIVGSLLIILIHFLLAGENTIWLIVAIFINSQLEGNIIHAWICNKTMKVHPLFLFVALLVNEYLFGLIGVILSPIVASIFQMCFVTYSEYLNHKNVGGWEKIASE